MIDTLLSPHDPWMALADFRSYVDAQECVSQAWQDQAGWTRMNILKTASSGFFSDDSCPIPALRAEPWSVPQCSIKVSTDLGPLPFLAVRDA